MTRKLLLGLFLLLTLLLIGACSQNTHDQGRQSTQASFKLDFEKYTLDNGLGVVFHEDKSDPIVAVSILFHVGSNREVEGRTGFAHLFEHMLFQESQHVPQDQFFKMIQEVGGTLNGGTWEDGTIYFEVVPKNALERVLWLESDRMGWLLSTVTDEAFANQKAVVKNEKRQRVDNQPYGHTNYVVHKNLYPEGHPYSWQVIGSFEDLQNATLEDIRNFFTTWYGPNNATLVIAGDFDKEQTKTWIEKYFGEIKPAAPIEEPKTQRVTLSETKRVFHEDNFAKSPELNMVFPTLEQYEKDAYALDMLALLLAQGKKAPLYKVLVEERKLAPSVSANQDSLEVAGHFGVRIRAFPNVKLTDVEQAILDSFRKFEEDGFTDQDMDRFKASVETSFYNGLTSVFTKAFQLSQYNEYAGDPGFIEQDLKNSLAVTKEDVMRVYNAYIKDKPYVLTSFVPKGSTDLVAKDSARFPVDENDTSDPNAGREIAKTEIEPIPTSFDRSVPPPLGADPAVSVPDIWRTELANGAKALGIEHNELPLVTMSIVLRGGKLLDPAGKIGVANLMSDIMMEGTKNKTPIELEEAINDLGARIRMFTDSETITLEANMLRSRFDKALALVEEILLEPRWDDKEFERIKQETLENINRRKASARSVASDVFNRLVYGADNPLGQPTIGSPEAVESITMADLKDYYQRNFSPHVASISIVGAITQAEAVEALGTLAEKWSGEPVAMPEIAMNDTPSSQLFFVDIPKAAQSELRVGYLGPAYSDAEYYDATVMNYKLGGSFNSVLNMILREEKGYTYGARSGFSGSLHRGPFLASSAVVSSATYDSTRIIKEEIAKYKQGVSEEDLAFTKNSLVKSNARRFETQRALLNMLEQISLMDLPNDYIKRQEEVARNMTLERHRELAQKYLPDNMVYLVVGDAETQMAPLEKLGLGAPVQLNAKGEKLDMSN